MVSLKVAVLMPCLNEEASVDRTLESLFANTRLPDEVIVADGGSTDGTLAKIEAWRAKGYNITVVDNPKVFPGAGRNEAFKVSTADVLLAFDFGNHCDPDYVDKMVSPFERDPSIDVVAGTFKPVISSRLEKAVAIVGYLNNYLIDRLSVEQRLAAAPADGNHTPGMSVAWRRTLWDETGGQPEWLRAAEDLLFGRRLLGRGVNIGLQVTAQIHHHMRSSLGEFYSMNRHYARGRGRTGLVTSLTVTEMCASALFTILFVAGFTVPWLWGAAAGVLGAHLLMKAIKPLYKAERFGASILDVWNCSIVALAGTSGVIVGTLQGVWDWHTDSSWRENLRGYLGSASLRNPDL